MKPNALVQTFKPPAFNAMALKAAGIAALFLMHLVLARELPVEDYGSVTYAINMANFIGTFLSLGMASSVVRFFAEYEATSEWIQLRGFLRTAVIIIAVNATLLALTIFAIAHLATINEPLKKSLLMTAVVLPTAAFLRLRKKTLEAAQAPYASILLDEILLPTLVILLFLGLYLFDSAWGAVWSYVIASVGCAMIAFGRIRRAIPSIRSSKGRTGLRVRHWFRVSLPMMAGSVAQVFLKRTDLAMLGILNTMESVAIYAIATRIATLLMMPNAALSVTFVPRIARQIARGNYARGRSQYMHATRISILVAVPLCVFLGIFADAALSLFGSQYAQGALVLGILIVGMAPNAILGPSGNTLNVLGKERQFGLSLSLAAVVNVFANYVLITRFGLIGAAIATATVLFTLKTYHFSAVLLDMKTRKEGTS